MEYIEHPLISKNTIEKRKYQEAIVVSAVTGNTLAVLPTGMGKTSIAAMVAAHRLKKDHNKKIFFLAPTRPLVEQQFKSFKKFLKVEVEDFKVITGEDIPQNRYHLYKQASIIFSTPQTIKNDLKKRTLSLEDVSLMVIDEAHRAVGNYAYSYVAKVYMNQSKDPLILALTASPGADRTKINEVKGKLYIENVEIKSREDFDVKPYVQEVKNYMVTVELTNELKAIKEYLENIKNDRIKKLMSWRIVNTPMVSKTMILRLQQQLAKRKNGMAYAAISRLAEVLKVDHALMLLETQTVYAFKEYIDSMLEQESKAVQRIIKDENFINASKLTDKLINEKKEHPKVEKLKEIIQKELDFDKNASIIVFAHYRDTISKLFDELKNVPKMSPVEFVGQAKKKGKGLSQKEQVQILNEFGMGFYNILIASSVAEEGLDIAETSMVIFYEPVPSAVRRIQRAGRTARTTSGKVTVLVTKDTRDEAYYWSGHNKEKNMKKILRNMQVQKTLMDT